MFELLASYGITTSILQLSIIAAIAVVILGMYWHYIVPGVAILFCVYVFTMPTTKNTNNMVEVKQSAPVETVISEEKDDTPAEYIQDCMKYTDKKESGCRDLWHEREKDE